MWLGIARIDVPPNSINRVTVFYEQVEVSTTTTTKDGNTTTEIKNTESDTNNKNKYVSDFVGITGHFSNSPASYVAVSVALGATFHTEGTSITLEGSNRDFNGFVFAKFYVRRPHLYATPRYALSTIARTRTRNEYQWKSF